jgi:hypothetical protein
MKDAATDLELLVVDEGDDGGGDTDFAGTDDDIDDADDEDTWRNRWVTMRRPERLRVLILATGNLIVFSLGESTRSEKAKKKM